MQWNSGATGRKIGEEKVKAEEQKQRSKKREKNYCLLYGTDWHWYNSATGRTIGEEKVKAEEQKKKKKKTQKASSRKQTGHRQRKKGSRSERSLPILTHSFASQMNRKCSITGKS